MNESSFNRRNFLVTSGSVVSGGWLFCAIPLIFATAQAASGKRDLGEAFTNLQPLEAADLEAMAEQILPSNETPGAREVGVIWFIDTALGGFFKDVAALIKDGLAELNAGLDADYRFADLDPEKQRRALQAIETTPFFDMVHFLTVAGMFALPGYGGNREKLGWALLGFEDRHAWQPPFGYYDQVNLPEVSS